MKFTIFQASRQGGRKTNQDRVGYSYSREALVIVVADGMGGHEHGEIAAQIAVQVIVQRFANEALPILPNPVAFLEKAMLHAHEAIRHYSRDRQSPDSPRTTCVAAVVQNDSVVWIHSGDSRLYLFRDGRLVTRTRDHSLVHRLFDQGRITEAEMRIHPDRNKVFSCLGGEVRPTLEVSAVTPLFDGDTLLLCTDGFWGLLSVNEMASIFRAYPLDRALNELMDHAEFRAGATSDNISAVGLTWGEDTHIDEGVSTLLLTEGAVTTHMPERAIPSGPVTEVDIERTIAEINAAIHRYSE